MCLLLVFLSLLTHFQTAKRSTAPNWRQNPTWMICLFEFLSSGPTHSSISTPRVKFLFNSPKISSNGRVSDSDQSGSTTGQPPSCFITFLRGLSLTSDILPGKQRSNHNTIQNMMAFDSPMSMHDWKKCLALSVASLSFSFRSSSRIPVKLYDRDISFCVVCCSTSNELLY